MTCLWIHGPPFSVFLYGTTKNEDFWGHRLELLKAAHKYIIGDLEDACDESLMQDIVPDNVLDRLERAWLYQLSKLKKRCFKHLFECGKIHDIRDKVDDFVQGGHQELKEEMYQEKITLWKPV